MLETKKVQHWCITNNHQHKKGEVQIEEYFHSFDAFSAFD